MVQFQGLERVVSELPTDATILGVDAFRLQWYWMIDSGWWFDFGEGIPPEEVPPRLNQLPEDEQWWIEIVGTLNGAYRSSQPVAVNKDE